MNKPQDPEAAETVQTTNDQAVDPVAICSPWCPDRCPITRLEFFCWIEHPERGLVPTYGGPYDSYTIPEMDGDPADKWHDRDLIRERFDHDEGAWKDGVEVIDLKIVHEDELIEHGFWANAESSHGGKEPRP